MTSSPRKPQISSPKPSAPSLASSRRPSSVSSTEIDDGTRVHSPTSAASYNIPFARPLQSQSPIPPNTTGSQSYLRPQLRTLQDGPARLQTQSPAAERGTPWQPGHRARQHSQGFFEPTLPSTYTKEGDGGALTAANIAAREAMQQLQFNQHNRKRSQTLPDPSATTPTGHGPTSPTSPRGKKVFGFGQPSNPNVRFNDGFIGGHNLIAASAATAAFPRGVPGAQVPPDRMPPPVPEKDLKPGKEKSKMKLFSKPKNITLGKDKDVDKRYPALPSPNKLGYPYRGPNMSTTSLMDHNSSSAASIYSQFNSSTSTLVPADRDRDKSKHGFLSRQKHKAKDELANLPVSSASSTSRLADPNALQPLYSFAAPSSPGPTSTFHKSVSGLDLRHGGRALREKKKEEKAAALLPTVPSADAARDRDNSLSVFAADWAGMPSYTSIPSSTGQSGITALSEHPLYAASRGDLQNLGNVFGVPGITPDDAWPLLKARLLNIFEGEDLRPPIEDFNNLVTVYLRRCIQQRAPTIVIEDLDELFRTGFMSLDQTLRHVPDDRLVRHIVTIWMEVFTRILPFLQAVFHPLDLEFKGRGPLMTPREAADFWGASPAEDSLLGPPASRTLGEDMDVRKFILLTFRDTVILPRHESLLAIFSRLSLDSLNAHSDHLYDLPTPLPIRYPPVNSGSRPGTAASMNPDMLPNSLNSTSTNNILESTSAFSTPSFSNARSRATSNTSAGSFTHSNLPPAVSYMHSMPVAQPLDSADVTEIVGRTLQCVSVLASVQSGDESQRKIEGLARELKYNWLGRGRTGRQRRGFVGARIKRVDDGASSITAVQA